MIFLLFLCNVGIRQSGQQNWSVNVLVRVPYWVCVMALNFFPKSSIGKENFAYQKKRASKTPKSPFIFCSSSVLVFRCHSRFKIISLRQSHKLKSKLTLKHALFLRVHVCVGSSIVIPCSVTITRKVIAFRYFFRHLSMA